MDNRQLATTLAAELVDTAVAWFNLARDPQKVQDAIAEILEKRLGRELSLPPSLVTANDGFNHQRLSAKGIIREMLDAPDRRCCPNCHSKGPFQVENDKCRTINDGRERYDSLRCDCGQRWTEGYTLTYFPRVEYRNNVGDTVNPQQKEML